MSFLIVFGAFSKAVATIPKRFLETVVGTVETVLETILETIEN